LRERSSVKAALAGTGEMINLDARLDVVLPEASVPDYEWIAKIAKT